nr:MAG TPA: hypothetical protein [Caudoviricetes sp.]
MLQLKKGVYMSLNVEKDEVFGIGTSLFLYFMGMKL